VAVAERREKAAKSASKRGVTISMDEQQRLEKGCFDEARRFLSLGLSS